MRYCVSGLAFRNCEYNFDLTRQTGVFYEIWRVVCCVGFFSCEIFTGELWLKKSVVA